MATPQLDERPQITALRATLDAAFTTQSEARAYDVGTVPGADGNSGVLPGIYATVQLERRYAPSRRLSGQRSTTGWRVTLLAAGSTADEARWALHRITRALEGQALAIAGGHTTPLEHESSRKVTKDVSRFTGSATYTYGL